MIREARIAGMTFTAKPDDGKVDDTTPFEVSLVVIDDRRFFAHYLTSDELTVLAKFFAQAALDLEEAGV